MKTRALVVAIGVLALLSSHANAQLESGQEQQQQQVCQEEAFRLCEAAIPDHERVYACLMKNRSKLGAECRATLDNQSKTQSR